MKVLVLNCGSSSIKFQMFEMDKEDNIAKGIVEKIGSSNAILTFKSKGREKIVQTREIMNHQIALDLVLNTLMNSQYGILKSKSEIDAIGHRLVHGGEEFAQSVFITDEVKEGLRRCIQFAPLHNPHNLKGVEVCEKILPGIPQVGVFDTAFHHSLPPKAYIYALPMALYRKLRIRRYGFHGTSHKYVVYKAAKYLKTPIEKLKIISCHLGNGCSITAVDGGKSVDTSMGFTPLEGLVMGTRCGDIDPALVSYIAQNENLSLEKIDNLMNKSSGMLGLTETSNDLREIELEAEKGSKQHKLAIDIFCYRIKKYIGAYAAVLGELDVLIFTAGIGEKSSYIRGEVLKNMEYLGIKFHPKKNNKNEFDIGTGKVKVLVIPTNEELAIARDTVTVLNSIKKETEKPVSEEIVSEEISQLTSDDKAELISIWFKNPYISPLELSQKLSKKSGKKVSIHVVKQELKLLGLDKVSEKKKIEFTKRTY